MFGKLIPGIFIAFAIMSLGAISASGLDYDDDSMDNFSSGEDQKASLKIVKSIEI